MKWLVKIFVLFIDFPFFLYSLKGEITWGKKTFSILSRNSNPSGTVVVAGILPVVLPLSREKCPCQSSTVCFALFLSVRMRQTGNMWSERRAENKGPGLTSKNLQHCSGGASEPRGHQMPLPLMLLWTTHMQDAVLTFQRESLSLGENWFQMRKYVLL